MARASQIKKATNQSAGKSAKKVANKMGAKVVATKTPAKRADAKPPSASRKAVAKEATPKKRAKSYELKTKETVVSVDDFLTTVENPMRVAQSHIAIDILKRVTGEEPRMWGPSIVGFGKYNYVYDSGHSGQMCVTGFSPRKSQFVFYVMMPTAAPAGLWSGLGKYKLGGSCLYVKKFEDIDLGVLEKIAASSVAAMRAKYPD